MADELFESIGKWWRTVWRGPAPKINKDYLLTGAITSSLKRTITTTINDILDEFPENNFKFGKTGFAEVRADQIDYRSAPYKHMFLLYQSSSKQNVGLLESYYAEKYLDDEYNDNVHTHSAGNMKSVNGRYYLYMVI